MKKYLLLDRVHLFKSARKNLLTQGNEELSFMYQYIEDTNLILSANLKDLEDLHFSEQTSIVKLCTIFLEERSVCPEQGTISLMHSENQSDAQMKRRI